MTSLVPVQSKAVDLYQPRSMESVWNHLATKVAGQSLENAIYENNHLSPVPSPSAFTERNFVHFRVSLNTPRCLRTDSPIGVEIFAAPPAAPTAPGNRKPPVLIFSHGYGAHPSKYRPFLAELANHGFTVLSLTHASSVKEIPGLTPEEEPAKMEQLSDVMEHNIQYVLGMVRQGALNDLGDPNRIVLIGHSLGGATSIKVSRDDPAISGCVNLDGFLKGKAKTDGLKQPLQMIIGDHQTLVRELEQSPDKAAREYAKYMSQSLEEYDTLRDNSPRSEKIMIPMAEHNDFTDKPFLDYLAGEKNLTLSTALRVHSIASREVLKFLGSCLSGK